MTDHERTLTPTFICLVIIKGTQVYDDSKGSFVDLSVLDVLQVFGRAGRPGLATSGQGFICTTADKLQHYLDAVTSQVRVSCLDSYMTSSDKYVQNPIESKYVLYYSVRPWLRSSFGVS
jgi:replicative superfamily II helicase